ncbi:hypothetical protein N431DRAFT_335436 [Stipitochalara longipes BDJ]|nr:hypothetical protein N431DRAFT_335436 [Stipitochalara longipes BDJ]
MRFVAIHVVFLGLLPNLSTAQGSPSTENPLTVPACSTMLSIVESCESKLVDANTITASVFSCLCFDGSGKYAPAVYDNAVAGCSSAFPTESTDFDFWLPGFCTNSDFATGTAAVSSTTAGVTTTTAVGFTGTTTRETGFSSSPTLNPGGLINTTISNRTSTTSAPTSTSAGAAGHVSSTSSKAEGMKMGYISGDASFWSIIGSILSAILIF